MKADDFREIAIPKLPGHMEPGIPAKVYAGYVENADWFPAAHRTKGGLYGLVVRKDATVIASDGLLPEEDDGETTPLKAFLGDVTGAGHDFEAFARMLVDELLQVGRSGILVDWTAGPAPNDTTARAEPLGRRVTWTPYRAEDIEDWAHETVGGERFLSMMKLTESTTVRNPKDRWETWPRGRYRLLELVGQVYTVTVYQEKLDEGGKPEKGEYELRPSGEDGIRNPMVPKGPDGAAFDRIPFVLAPCMHVKEPPLLAVVRANLSHLRTAARSENAQGLAGSPTLMLAGPGVRERFDQRDGSVVKQNEAIVLGGGNVLLFGDQVHHAMIAVGMETLAGLEAVLERKQRQMVILGARVIESEQAPAESGVAKDIDDSRDHSQLAEISTDASKALTEALEWTLRWLGLAKGKAAKGKVTARVNRDFFSRPMSVADILGWFQVLQGGGIAPSDFVHALTQGESLRDGRTWEEIQEELEASPPPGGVAVPSGEVE